MNVQIYVTMYVEIESVKIMNKFSYFPFIIMIIMKFYLNMNIYAC